MACVNAGTPTKMVGQLRAFVLINGKPVLAPPGSYKYAGGTYGSTKYAGGTIVVQQNGMLPFGATVPPLNTTASLP